MSRSIPTALALVLFLLPQLPSEQVSGTPRDVLATTTLWPGGITDEFAHHSN